MTTSVPTTTQGIPAAIPAAIQALVDQGRDAGMTVVPVNAASAAFVVVGAMDGTVDIQQFGGLSQEDVGQALIMIAAELGAVELETIAVHFSPDELLELAGALADARPIHTPNLDQAMRLISHAADAVVNADRANRHG